MLCIHLTSTEPRFNLAVDEFLLKNREEDFLVLSVNTPSVIIGKHQVAHREADTKFVTEKGIPVVRRISGGGAVFHDEGNLNFSFILRSSHGKQVDFRKYTQPVISFLSSLGVDAKFEGKNDLKVGGLKISGNAEHVYRQRVLHHGTLLFSSQLDILRKALRKDTSSYITRAVSSNPSPVMNLSERLKGISLSDFTSSMLDFFLSLDSSNSMAELAPDEDAAVRKLAETRYGSWEWNYAYGPEYHFNRSFEVSGKPHQCSISVKNGIIMDCRIEGSEILAAFAEKLIGCRHMPEMIRDVLKESERQSVFKVIDNFAEWIF